MLLFMYFVGFSGAGDRLELCAFCSQLLPLQIVYLAFFDSHGDALCFDNYTFLSSMLGKAGLFFSCAIS